MKAPKPRSLRVVLPRFFATLALLLLTLPLTANTLADAGSSKADSHSKTWRVVLARDVFTDYERFIRGRNPLSLQHFDGPFSRRDVVELVLLQQALQRGGALRPLHFLLTDSEGRTLKALSNGDADISGASSWQDSAEHDAENLLASHALIHHGEFMAGLYFPDNHPALKILQQRPQDIHRYTAVCASSWAPDLASLNRLGSPVLRTENWESMLGMLKKQRGDYVLAPFQPTPDFRLDAGGIVLKPVPGVKVSLSGSRHFILWRGGIDSDALAAAINRGLTALEKDGILQRAYRESGFENPQLKSWHILNP
jgi:hypothetical protein